MVGMGNWNPILGQIRITKYANILSSVFFELMKSRPPIVTDHLCIKIIVIYTWTSMIFFESRFSIWVNLRAIIQCCFWTNRGIGCLANGHARREIPMRFDKTFDIDTESLQQNLYGLVQPRFSEKYIRKLSERRFFLRWYEIDRSTITI